MSELTFPVMDVASARRLTERIRLNVVAVRDGVEKLQALLEEAKEGNVHVALGYPSWPAYVADVMGEEPLRLSRDDRREIVHYLTGEGMSTRAIGQALGVSGKTVHQDRQVLPKVTPACDQRIRPTSNAGEAPIEAEVVDDDDDDEADDPDANEHIASLNARVTAPRTVVGLDGKTYSPRPATPPPAPDLVDEPDKPAAPRRRALTDAFFDAVYDLVKKAESVHRLVEDDRFPQNAEKVAAKHRNDLLRTRALIDQVLAQLPQEE